MQTDYANMLELLRTYELHNIQNREKNIRNAKLRPWYNLSRNEPAVPLFLCQFRRRVVVPTHNEIEMCAHFFHVTLDDSRESRGLTRTFEPHSRKP